MLGTAPNEETTSGAQVAPGPLGVRVEQRPQPNHSRTLLTHGIKRQVELEVPRDRESTFEPVFVKKRYRRLGEVDEMALSLHVRGLTIGKI